jgi:hypothetical protein
MIASSETEFFLNDIESELKFVLDDHGKPSRLLVYRDGKEIPLQRVSDQ